MNWRRVLRYPRLQAFFDFVGDAGLQLRSFPERESSEIITLDPFGLPAPIRDPNDIIVMQTAIIGEADRIVHE